MQDEAKHRLGDIRRKPSEGWKACQLCTARQACRQHAAEATAFWSGVAEEYVSACQLARAVEERDELRRVLGDIAYGVPNGMAVDLRKRATEALDRLGGQ